MTTEEPVWFIVYHLFDIKHYSLMTKAQEKRLHRVDDRAVSGGVPGEGA